MDKQRDAFLWQLVQYVMQPGAVLIFFLEKQQALSCTEKAGKLVNNLL